MTKSKRLQQTLDQISGAAAEVLRPTTPTLAQALRNSHNPDNLRLYVDGELSHEDVATILAALRYWQARTLEGERKDFEHFEDGTQPLTDRQINNLCERINLGPGPVTNEQDESLCTCANRSWYGEEHDTACELEGKR
jgi:hypothetical protein